jgi:hypothetical protein
MLTVPLARFLQDGICKLVIFARGTCVRFPLMWRRGETLQKKKDRRVLTSRYAENYTDTEQRRRRRPAKFNALLWYVGAGERSLLMVPPGIFTISSTPSTSLLSSSSSYHLFFSCHQPLLLAKAVDTRPCMSLSCAGIGTESTSWANRRDIRDSKG